MVHADLRPELISVPVKKGENFSILDRLGDPSPPNQVQLNNLKAQKKLYMSPALFHALISKEPKVRHNPFKSDIFSLGLIILEASLLESVQGIYTKEDSEIDHSALVDLVEKFILKYDKNFILQEMLLVMLEFSEKLRQEPIKLLKTLQTLRETEILDSQLFNEVILQKQNSINPMENINVTSSGFQIKETKLTNLSILYGLQGSEIKTKENNFKTTLVEMLKDRVSHNASKKNEMLEEFKLKNNEELNSQILNNTIEISNVKIFLNNKIVK